MARWLSDYRLFLSEFVRTFHTTGAVLPSSPRLARALSRYVAESPDGGDSPRHILEVGPGTGSVTQCIVRSLGAADRLDLVELNERFVAKLRHRFEQEPDFVQVAERVEIIHDRVENLIHSAAYDLIVSGLPLNNFSVAAVEEILAALRGLLKPGGTLSFFQYAGVRPLRAIASRGTGRARLRGIGKAINDTLRDHEVRRELVLSNIPPAWVHHVCWRPEPAGLVDRELQRQ